jgi:hypothetical protein
MNNSSFHIKLRLFLWYATSRRRHPAGGAGMKKDESGDDRHTDRSLTKDRRGERREHDAEFVD